MKTLLLTILLLPVMGYAHCPLPLEIDGKSYCTSIEWLDGEHKVKNDFISAQLLSPQLVSMGPTPTKTVFSQAQFLIWEDGDSTHTPQEIENFRVFPFMHMSNGHDHPGSYESSFDETTGLYNVRGMALREMKGCWTLRWTTASDDSFDDSEKLLDITEYVNADDDKNQEMSDFCENAGSGGHGNHGGHQHSH